MDDSVMGQGAAYAEDAPDLPHAGRNVRQLTRDDLRLVQVDTQTVQALAEGVVEVEDDPNLIEFMGERFRIAESIGLMPLLRFANASKKGLDSDDMEGMAALYTVIRDTVDQRRPPKLGEDGEQSIDPISGEPEWSGPSDWMRFEEHAMATKAEGEDLMDFVNRAMAVVAARPRKRREISSGGSPQTSGKSKAGSSLPANHPQADGLIPVAELGR